MNYRGPPQGFPPGRVPTDAYGRPLMPQRMPPNFFPAAVPGGQGMRVDPPQPTVPQGMSGVPVLEVERPLGAQYAANLGARQTLAGPGLDVPYDALGIKETEIEVLQNQTAQCRLGESIIVCLALAVVSNDVQEAVYATPMLRAKIRFGNGSVLTTFECDWLNGTQIALGAKQVSVNAVYRIVTRPYDVDVLAAPPVFDLEAMTAYGSLNQNSHGARLTEVVQIEDASGTQTIRIPDFATSFTVIPVNSSSWTARMFGWGTSRAADYAGGGAATDATTYQVENAFPHFGGARFLEFTNANEEDSLEASVVFDLAF